MNNPIKYLFLLLLSVGTFTLSTAQYKTKALQDNIKTVQVSIVGSNKFAEPVIELKGNQVIKISFDEMSHDSHNYLYTVEHCNVDWTPSSISPLEWANGFTSNITVTDEQMSQNTTVNYTHYAISLPNEDLRFKVSGNYVISFYEDSNPDVKVATACFSIVDSKVAVDATVRGNTDIDINGKMQQLDFTILTGNYAIDNPLSELKLIVCQNGRYDNMVTDLTPNSITKNKIGYTNNKALIFEGGIEYHSFDISSIYAFGEGVNKIRFYDPYYHAELFPDKIDPWAAYIYKQDVDGKFVVNIQNQDDDDVWADYILVHFTLPTEKPFFDGFVYLLGGFNYNQLDDAVRMTYNTTLNAYEKTVLLKQGGYNYLYGFVQKGTSTASTKQIESSHWETENKYTIYIYQRAFGDRYDKLIGVKILQSGK